MSTRFSYWLRAFRPPLQRAYPCTDEAAREFEDLLRQADRSRATGERPADNRDSQAHR